VVVEQELLLVAVELLLSKRKAKEAPVGLLFSVLEFC
jgi:hypothetical protein